MKKLLRVLSLSIAMLLVLSLTAPIGYGFSALAVEEKIVLDFPSWQATEPGFAEFWADLIDRFTTDHPNVEINLYQVPFSGYVDTLVTRFSSNNAPDICHIPAANFFVFHNQGWFENLDSRFAGTDIVETWTPLQSAIQGADGGNYGLLMMGYAQILYYNEKLLDEASVSVPTTLDEFMDAARKMTKDDQFGFATCTTTSPSVMAQSAQFIYGNGGSWADGQNIRLDDPLVIEGLNAYKAVYTEGLSPLGVTIEQARTYFIDGKAGMMIDGSYFYASLKTAPEDVRPYLKAARIPAKVVTGSPSNSIHIPVGISEERKELVWEFIKLIATDEYQEKYALYTNNPPPKSTAMTDELIQKLPELEMFAEEASKAIELRPAAFIPVYTEFSKIMVDEIMAFVTDPDMTAEQALKNMDAAVRRDIMF